MDIHHLDYQAMINALSSGVKDQSELISLLAKAGGFISVPPSIEEFMESDYYLGKVVEVYPFWKGKLKEIYPSPFYSPYKRIIASGSIGIGKSTLCRVGMAYDLCCFLHREDPHKDFGFNKAEPISIVFCNATMTLAEDVQTNTFKDMLAMSPFFKEQRAKKSKSKRLTRAESDINMPHNIEILAGSQARHALGRAVLCAMQSEINHIRGSKAFEVFMEIQNRIDSRFNRGEQYPLPGRIWLDSSKKEAASFLENYIESVQDDPSTLIIDAPQWEVLGTSGKRFYCGETFQVFKGSEAKDPFVLNGTPEFHNVPESAVIDVPVEYKDEFRLDPSTALRDIAGVSTWSTGSYITSIEAIEKALCLENVVERNVIELDFHRDDDQIINYLNLSKLPKGTPYFFHVDLSKSKDRTGIAGTRSIGKTTVERKDLSGAALFTQEDELRTDILIAIEAKAGQEIPLYKIERFFVDFVWAGFAIAGISFDQAFSADLMQRLQKKNYPVQYVSVDRTREPYDTWKNALLEGRWQAPDHPILKREIKKLVDHGVRRTSGPVIDHPEVAGTGYYDRSELPSKDLSDACAGSVWHLQLKAPGKSTLAWQEYSKAIMNEREESNRRVKGLYDSEHLMLQQAMQQKRFGNFGGRPAI